MTKKFLAPEEELVVVPALVFPRCQSRKPVQIQLTLKGGEFGLTKIGGHDILTKALGIVNDKAPPMRLPTNDTGETVCFNLIEHFVELQRKWYCHAALDRSVTVEGQELERGIAVQRCGHFRRMIGVLVLDYVTVLLLDVKGGVHGC